MGHTRAGHVTALSGSPPVTGQASSFSDTFIRANSLDIGTDWDYRTARLNINDHYIVPSIVGNRLRFVEIGGSILTVNPCTLIPRSLEGSTLVYGVAQFAQATFEQTTGAGESGGVCVFARHDAVNGASVNPVMQYHLRVNNALNTVLGQRIGSTGTNIVVYGVGTTTVGDVLRLEVTPGALGVNTLRVFRNGVLFDTQTDNAITQQGLPGLMADDMQLASTQEWSNFSCGIL
jgi:hypothetical protein